MTGRRPTRSESIPSSGEQKNCISAQAVAKRPMISAAWRVIVADESGDELGQHRTDHAEGQHVDEHGDEDEDRRAGSRAVSWLHRSTPASDRRRDRCAPDRASQAGRARIHGSRRSGACQACAHLCGSIRELPRRLRARAARRSRSCRESRGSATILQREHVDLKGEPRNGSHCGLLHSRHSVRATSRGATSASLRLAIIACWRARPCRTISTTRFSFDSK